MLDFHSEHLVPSAILVGLTVLLVLVMRVLRFRVLEDGLLGRLLYRISVGILVLVTVSTGLSLFGFDLVLLFDRLMNRPLTTFGTVQITPITVVLFVGLLIGSYYGSLFAREATIRGLHARQIGDEGTVASVSRLVQYAAGFGGVAVALDVIGIDLTTLVTAGAVFAVGIGFALQNIAQNFVSGVILLMERSISPGDIVEVDGVMVRIRVLGIRSTIASTLDDEQLIIPNSFLVQSNVKNLTLNDHSLRIRLVVGVAYESDLQLVLWTLESAALDVKSRLDTKSPVVALVGFGASSVDFEVSVWTPDPWQKLRVKSDLAFALWDALHAEGITIAFPQLDVHFDTPPPWEQRPQGPQNPLITGPSGS